MYPNNFNSIKSSQEEIYRKMTSADDSEDRLPKECGLNIYKSDKNNNSIISDNLLLNNKKLDNFTLNSLEFKMLVPHPLMEVIPKLNATQNELLEQDILLNGFLDTVLITKNFEIVDGRARVEISNKINYQDRIRFSFYEGNESQLLDLILSKNIFRRNMNKGQRAVGALKLLEIVKDENSEKLSIKMSQIKKNEFDSSANTHEQLNSRNTVAKYFNISPAYIGKAKKVFDSNQNLINDVLEGKRSLEDAYQSCTNLKKKSIKTLDEFLTIYEAEYSKLENIIKVTIDFLIDIGLRPLFAGQIITNALKTDSIILNKWDNKSPNNKFEIIFNNFLNSMENKLIDKPEAYNAFIKIIDKDAILQDIEKTRTIDDRIYDLKQKLSGEEQIIWDNTYKHVLLEKTINKLDNTIHDKIKNYAIKVIECTNGQE